MRSVSGVGRVAALGAVVGAIALVAILLFGGGDGGYTVTAKFVNAGQLVTGNPVVVAGVPAGSVEEIEITDDGQAEVELSIDDRHAPLRDGTRAEIRMASLSGIANRYVELRIPPAGSGGQIEDGGRIGIDRTKTQVELDELFNALDPETREAIQRFFKGSAQQYAARGEQANRGFRYLSPALASSRRLFEELTRDTKVLERFLVDSSKLVTALAERDDDLADLIGNLNEFTRAIGDEKEALAGAIERFPGFMRRANTTFVNLRGALDDLDPLVDASKPVAKRLQPFLADLRAFSRDAKPTISDLSEVVKARGADNDLIDLTKTYDPLAKVAVDETVRNGEKRRGAFAEIAKATADSAPVIGFGRPYTPELFGWFDDFSTPGVTDAMGGILRFQVVMNAFSVMGDTPVQIPLNERAESFKNLFDLNEHRRCPGGGEARAPDGSNVLSEQLQKELGCRELDRAVDN